MFETVLHSNFKPDAIAVVSMVGDGRATGGGSADVASNQWVKLALSGRWDLHFAAAPYPRRWAAFTVSLWHLTSCVGGSPRWPIQAVIYWLAGQQS